MYRFSWSVLRTLHYDGFTRDRVHTFVNNDKGARTRSEIVSMVSQKVSRRCFDGRPGFTETEHVKDLLLHRLRCATRFSRGPKSGNHGKLDTR